MVPRARRSAVPAPASTDASLIDAIVHGSQEAIYVLDPDDDFRLIFVNDATCRHFGRTREELLRLSPADWDPTLTRERVRACWGSRTSEPVVLESVHRRADGSLVPVEIFASVLRYQGRDLVLGSIRDITARKRIEQSLRESEERYRDLVEHSEDLICTHDLEGRLLSVNRKAADMLGHPVEQLLTMRLIDVIEPESRGALPVYLQRIREHGKASGIMRVITASGERRIWEYRNTLKRDGVAEPIVRGMAHDVTAYRATLAALHESEERLRILVEQAADGIVVLDERGTVVEANTSFARMLGCEPLDVLALHISDWDARYPSPGAASPVPVTLPDVAGTAEVQIRRRDGTTFDAEISHTPTLWAGQRLLFYVCRDITERRRSESERAKLQAQLVQAQKMESVGRLAGGVAHDFNNMLSVILGFTEMALASIDPADHLHAQIQEIRQAAQRSSDLTRQLLTFSRQQTVAPRVLDLNETVSGALKMLRRLIGEDIQLTWSPAGGLWAVNIDPAQVDQLLLNLAVNARDAIGGVGTITIATGNATVDAGRAVPSGLAPGDYVTLTIHDDGGGMTPEVIDHLFEPFFTTKPVGQGTGLGLATAYGIVKQNSGFIDVSSEQGRGATFTIYLPRVNRPSQEGSAQESVTESVTKRPSRDEGRGRTVLLVEDEAAILRLGRAMLEGLGYTVLAAPTPAEGLRIAASHPGTIDLLITDVVMPGMNGLELAGQLAAARPEVRCLFMSGYTADVIAHRGILNEGVQYLQKPFSRLELAAKVRETLGDAT